jgi:ABC-type uncharacterized transport system substrate-binding protein
LLTSDPGLSIVCARSTKVSTLSEHNLPMRLCRLPRLRGFCTRTGGLILTTDTFTNLRSNLIADLAARHRLPTISAYERFPKDGGLMYYGATINVPDQFRQAATYVDRIFKGVKPGELPIQCADKYSLIINLKTAKALGSHRPAAANGSG